jgi:undecaprenyl phosphate-alpha-L-ara4N flippase subunit ArnE
VTPIAVVFAVVTICLNGGAQLLLRQAAMGGAQPTDPLSLLRSPWFMGGLAAYGFSVLTWLFVLKRVPLAVAAPFVALVYVLVPLASRVLFADSVTPKMWLGMVLIVCGVTLVAEGAPRSGPDAAEAGARSSP